MEHRALELNLGCDRGGLWCVYSGSKHTLSVLWNVEDQLLLAHGGHGPLQHQLPALWRAQILVGLAVFFCVSSGRIALFGLLSSCT